MAVFSKEERELVEQAFALLQKKIFAVNAGNGFWDRIRKMEEAGFAPEARAVKVALVHSEETEKLEAIRNASVPGNQTADKHCPQYSNELIETADVMVREFDYTEGFLTGESLADALMDKVEINATRGKGHGGKAF